jgi:general secretion pathway protein H
MVIFGITFGLITFNALPTGRQALQNDAQRVALLLQLARDEAIVRNRPIAFETDGTAYRFLIRNDNSWQPLPQDDMLREREFKHAPITLSIDPPLPQQDNNQLRIVFGREPVDKPFVLTLSTGEEHIALKADGIGHYTVE